MWSLTVFPRFPAVSLCTGGLYTLVIFNFGYLFVHPRTGTLQPGFLSLFSTSEILAGHDAGGRDGRALGFSKLAFLISLLVFVGLLSYDEVPGRGSGFLCL